MYLTMPQTRIGNGNALALAFTPRSLGGLGSYAPALLPAQCKWTDGVYKCDDLCNSAVQEYNHIAAKNASNLTNYEYCVDNCRQNTRAGHPEHCLDCEGMYKQIPNPVPACAAGQAFVAPTAAGGTPNLDYAAGLPKVQDVTGTGVTGSSPFSRPPVAQQQEPVYTAQTTTTTAVTGAAAVAQQDSQPGEVSTVWPSTVWPSGLGKEETIFGLGIPTKTVLLIGAGLLAYLVIK